MPQWRKINRPIHRASKLRSKLTESNTQQRSPNALSEAICDAELLMNHAARSGLAIESTVLNAITRTRELFNRGKLRPEEASEFYQNFSALSKATYPVNVRSLKSCTIPRQSRTWLFWRTEETRADQALNRHRRWGFAGLLLLTVVQTYWVIGSFLTTNLPILSDDEKQIQQGVEEQARWDLNKAVTPPLQTDDHKSEQAVDAEILKDEQDILKGRRNTQVWLLDVWTAPGLNAALFFDEAFHTTHGNIGAATAWKTGIVAKYILNIMQTYVLPPLYGWLGAMAYVLRRLISEINSGTYHSDSDTSYNLRIYLGVLAGLAIGWFVAPANKAGGNVLQALSPLALAFLAGYSVELLFSAMDRLLEAFSTKAPSSKAS